MKDSDGLSLSNQNAPNGLEALHVIRSRMAQRVTLRVDPARGRICLVVPKRGSERAAWKFADENREWIVERLSRLEKPVPFIDGAVLPILGKNRILRITKIEGRRTYITMNDHVLDVQTPREDASHNIRLFLEKRLAEVVVPMALEKAERIDKKVVQIQLRDTRSRWGSCSTDGCMMFCWRLVFAPLNVLDYVVAHEVAHLKHLNHSTRFWNVCAELSDDFDGGYDWLDINGDKLMRYGMRI